VSPARIRLFSAVLTICSDTRGVTVKNETFYIIILFGAATFFRPVVLYQGILLTVDLVRYTHFSVVILSLVILLIVHLVNLSFSHSVILAIGHFGNWSFWQLVILAISHFACLSFRQRPFATFQ
jgi:hypothetical protein